MHESESESEVTQSCPTLSDPMDYSTPGIPGLHYLSDLAQTHIHRFSDENIKVVFLPGESQGRGSLVAAVCGVAQGWTRLKRLSSSSNRACLVA